MHRERFRAGQADVGVIPEQPGDRQAFLKAAEDAYREVFADSGLQGCALLRRERRGAHWPALHTAFFDTGDERVFRQVGGFELDVIDRCAVGAAIADAPAGAQAETGCGQAQRFEQGAVRHVTGMTVEVVEDMLARVVAMDGDAFVVKNFETPGLRVVAAGRPAGKVEDVAQGFTVHGVLVTVRGQGGGPVGI